jgi:hypothetical protein
MIADERFQTTFPINEKVACHDSQTSHNFLRKSHAPFRMAHTTFLKAKACQESRKAKQLPLIKSLRYSDK